MIYFVGHEPEWKKQKALEAGLVQVGQSSSDMQGKKYQAIAEQLEYAGFVNIKFVDLDDAGLFINKEETVDSVTIGGDSSFSSSDFFDPNAVVIISYH